MKTRVGLTALNKLEARSLGPKWSVAIGTGGSDPGTGVAVAPSFNDVALKAQIFISASVDEIEAVEPPVVDTPSIEFRHIFKAHDVVPSGTAVTSISEYGVFVTDPDTSLPVLVDRRTFDNEAFSVPASGRSVSKDEFQLTLVLGRQ
jgi:hypothetical protein